MLERRLEASLGGTGALIEPIRLRRADARESRRVESAKPSRQASALPVVSPSAVSERAPEVVEASGAAHRNVAQTVRVDIRKLDALMNVVGELAIVKNSLARLAERIRAEGGRQLGSELHSIQRSFGCRLSENRFGVQYESGDDLRDHRFVRRDELEHPEPITRRAVPAPARPIARDRAIGTHLGQVPLLADRRVDGRAIRELLGVTLQYPTYREGLAR